MTEWGEISCQRGCVSHPTERIMVQLGGLTPYEDLAPIPMGFATEFLMEVWTGAPDDDLRWCPASDPVSETIRTLGVWEVSETIVLSSIFANNPDHVFLDIGCQLGWFSILAGEYGIPAMGFEVDPEVADVYVRNTGRPVIRGRISDTSQFEMAGDDLRYVVKIDIEGAEPAAIKMLRPALADSRVDYILIEMSPMFHDGYPALTRKIMSYGMNMGILPAKSVPPAKLESLEDLRWVSSARSASKWIGAQEQVNVVFARKELL